VPGEQKVGAAPPPAHAAPAGHVTVLEAEPAGQKLVAEHWEHVLDDAPTVVEKVPAGHCVHCEGSVAPAPAP
jgi:hypothetical protein